MTDSINTALPVAYGEVVNVQQIRSRGVTRIEIEIPIEFHVPATALLFGKGALVHAWEAGLNRVPYGVTTLGAFTKQQSQPRSGEPTHSRTGFGSVNRSKDYVQIAGIVCRNDPDFWAVLARHTHTTINNETDAANALRSLLSIAHRSELSSNVRAQKMFDELQAESLRLGENA
jgi:hypothetical protein